jgi:hypothetical protein
MIVRGNIFDLGALYIPALEGPHDAPTLPPCALRCARRSPFSVPFLLGLPEHVHRLGGGLLRLLEQVLGIQEAGVDICGGLEPPAHHVDLSGRIATGHWLGRLHAIEQLAFK